jgi:MFS family permease
MKKLLILILIALIPVYFVPFGYMNTGNLEELPATYPKVKVMLVNPATIALIGAVVTLILQHRRAMWWAMLVTFVYSYLGLGLIWGGFTGPFEQGLLNYSAVFAVIGFVGALFVFIFLTIFKKMVDVSKNPEKYRKDWKKRR